MIKKQKIVISLIPKGETVRVTVDFEPEIYGEGTKVSDADRSLQGYASYIVASILESLGRE